MKKPILELIYTALQSIVAAIESYKDNPFICTLFVCLEASENLHTNKLPDLLVSLVQHWGEEPQHRKEPFPPEEEGAIWDNALITLCENLSAEVARGTAPEQLVGVFYAHAQPLIAQYAEMKNEWLNENKK